MANRITGSEGLFGKVSTKVLRVAGSSIPSYRGTSHYVRSTGGSNSNNGKSWDKAFLTLQYALTKVNDYDTIWLVGRFDTLSASIPAGLDFLSIIGGGYGSNVAHLENNGEGAPVLTVNAKGFYAENLYIEAPSDSAGLKFSRTAGDINADHATLVNVRFWTGKYGVELSGAPHNFHWHGGEVRNMRASGAVGLYVSSAAQDDAKKALVENVIFQGNVTHVQGAFTDSVFRRCSFSHAASGNNDTTLQLDLSAGNSNLVTENQLAGTYDIAGGYRAGTDDNWNGNYGSSGITSGVPA